MAPRGAFLGREKPAASGSDQNSRSFGQQALREHSLSSLQTMFSALKSAVGVSLSGEVKHAFPSFHAISAVDIDGANVRVSPALLRSGSTSAAAALRPSTHANKRARLRWTCPATGGRC